MYLLQRLDFMTKRRVGRIQRQIRRAFIASGGRPLRIAVLLPWCYPRLSVFKPWHRTNVHRAARRFAIRVGKHGRANIWGPAPDATWLQHDD